MQFTVLALLAATLGAQTALADYMVIYTECTNWNCSSAGVWIEAFGVHNFFGVNEGCRNNPPVDGMQSICMDWNNRRGHFYFANQPKRCLSQTWSKDYTDHQAVAQWNEVACTW